MAFVLMKNETQAHSIKLSSPKSYTPDPSFTTLQNANKKLIQLSNSKESTNENNNNNNILSIIQTNHNEDNNSLDGDKTIKSKDLKKMSFDNSETNTNFNKNDSMSKIFEDNNDNFTTDDSTIKPDIKQVIDTTGAENNISSGIPITDLKQLIQKNTFQKPKYDFIYNDVDTMENEINEFYNYQDNPYIQEGKRLFEYSFQKEWITATDKERIDYITYLLETLEIVNSDQRSASATILLYLSQGVFAECSSKEEQMKWIKYNCRLLWQNDALPYCYQILKIGSSLLDSIVKSYDQNTKNEELQNAMNQTNSEISLYLSLLYMIVEVNNGEKDFSKDLDKLEPPLPAYLFNLVALLANRKNYPVKKLLLLLWKTMLASYGKLDQLKELKNELRKENGLDEIDESKQYVKATPEDYYQFYTETTYKYPSVYLSNVKDLPPLSSNEYKLFLNNNFKVLNNHSVLPFIDNESPVIKSIKEKSNIYQKNLYVSLSNLQMVEEKMRVKKSEAEKEYGYVVDPENNKEYLPLLYWKYIASANKDNTKLNEINERIENRKTKEKSEFDVIRSIRKLYKNLLPNMPTHIAMLVRLLYYINIGNNIQTKDQKLIESFIEIKKLKPETKEEKEKVKDLYRKYVDQIDLERHKEVVTKAVSAILLLLLKYTKYCHVLQCEYISQLLVDNNCSILILKMLSIWFQNSAVPYDEEIMSIYNNDNYNKDNENPVNPMSNTMAASWLCKKTNVKELNFFDFCRVDPNAEEQDENESKETNGEDKDNSNGDEEPKNEDQNITEGTKNNDTLETSEDKPMNENANKVNLYPSCWRNFFTSINLLRVLQIITKRKMHRILALVQWKTSAVLKRILRVNHIGIQLYVLKLLKSQIPFLGKKWKSSNMRIITAIYLNLRPDIEDNYLCNDNNEVDVDDALYQEQQLRNLIIHYHKRMFPNVNLDSENENNNNNNNNSNQSQKSIVDTFEDDFLSRLNLVDSSIKDADYKKNYENLELDENFMNNYEAWLNQEVWNEPDNDDLNNKKGSIEELHLSNEQIFNNLVSLDSDLVGSNLLFSNKKLNKDIFGDSYNNINTNDFEWYNDEDYDNDDKLSSGNENNMGWDYPLDENDEVWK
ncbi:N1221-domain-containing protein [Piromyces finnis]|uniref:N1221-domain-containing protein n=1 Tax=Piromyces finnis TaxID=1754191 RepID=A0A1Y1VFE7_9FUNG|nr:N1221-domain-containing protein [Piromyces finnis]|eukprot:ORX54162.1 N1221-domain-containing protein [Piromyces finnis]